MASEEHLILGRFDSEHDALLEECEKAMPSWLDDSFPAGIALRLIWLDQQKGVDSPENIICIATGYAMWLAGFVEIQDEELNQIIAAGDYTSEAVLERVRAIHTRGFKTKFCFPAETGFTGEYPDWIHGQVRMFRVLTDEEADAVSPAFTTKPDGTPLI